MVESYLPVLVFLALGSILGAAFATLNRFIGPRKPSRIKSEPSSEPPLSMSRARS